ncbi:MAG: hypothetical protein IKR39_12380 [Lachnospiraceae bacterium]|nr:hypothetical protein [Lachnospiraceae bacterium]
MKKCESDIETLFSEDIVIPANVQAAKERALEEIRSSEAPAHVRRGFLGSRAGLVAACVLAVLVLGTGSAVAATVYSRYEVYKAMEQYKIDYYYDVANSGGYIAFAKTREFKNKEEARYSELEKAYNNSEMYPEEELKIYKTADGIDKLNGVFLEVTPQGEENILHLPKRTLKDEEILEIIDHMAKENYAVTQKVKEFNESQGDYSNLFGNMTDSEVDYYYVLFHYSNSEFSGVYERASGAELVRSAELSAEEESRYRGLMGEYKYGLKKPDKTIRVIDYPEDYAGTGVAFCDSDNCYYIGEATLSDDEILQIIEMKLREVYVNMRMDEEIAFGKRKEAPKKSVSSVDGLNITDMQFSHTIGPETAVALTEAKVGDIVKFGKYEQNGNISDGAEDIEWYVLDKGETGLTLITKDAIQNKMFYSENAKTSWVNSDLRKWLNEEFINEAFSNNEKGMLRNRDNDNSDGVHSIDVVYMLSREEAYSYFGITADLFAGKPDSYEKKCEYYLNNVDSRLYARPSAYAVQNGAFAWTSENSKKMQQFYGVDVSKAEGTTGWWLRDTDEQGNSAFYIDAMGNIDGSTYVSDACGVRPVINIFVK